MGVGVGVAVGMGVKVKCLYIIFMVVYSLRIYSGSDSVFDVITNFLTSLQTF